MTNEQIEEFLKYHAYAYNQIDMQEAIEFLYEENKRLRKALEDVQRYSKDEVTNSRTIQYKIWKIATQVLEESE